MDLQPSADILSAISHPPTLARRRRGVWNSIVLSGGIRARSRPSTQNRAEFPRALVKVTSETGKLSDVTFTVVRGYCAGLLSQPLAETTLRMGGVFLSTGDQ